MANRIAVMDHRRSFFPMDLVEQVRHVADVVWVLNVNDPPEAKIRRFLSRLGTVVEIDDNDHNHAAEILADAGIDGIVSFVDDRLVIAARIAAVLGLPFHTPEVAEALVDKGLQHDALQRAGVPVASLAKLAAGVRGEDLAQLTSDIGYPAVLKPARGSGSRGIRYIPDAPALAVAIAAGSDEDQIVEAFLADDPTRPGWCASYLSVETIVSAGRVSHVALTGRFPLAESFRETGNFIPALVDGETAAVVLDIVDRAIKALGVTDSALHTEIKLTPSGPMLIEVNGRLGGRPPFVLLEVCEVNLFAAAMQVAAGEDVRIDGPVNVDGVGFWLMTQPPVSATVVTSMDCLENLAAVPGVKSVNVIRRPGEPVDWRLGTDSNVLTIRGRVGDHAELHRTVSGIEAARHIDYA